MSPIPPKVSAIPPNLSATRSELPLIQTCRRQFRSIHRRSQHPPKCSNVLASVLKMLPTLSEVSPTLSIVPSIIRKYCLHFRDWHPNSFGGINDTVRIVANVFGTPTVLMVHTTLPEVRRHFRRRRRYFWRCRGEFPKRRRHCQRNCCRHIRR